MKTREEYIDLLRNYKLRHATQYGIAEIGIFGSVARNEHSDQSDVDVCLRLNTPSFFTRMIIQTDLERLFNRPVDVVSLGARMRPLFKSQLQQDAIYV